ncbi:5'-nucleotidase [Apostasia shenzhenica]|uniref:5'-nucleotidase n=1 Tax=Apostasia shenzhenica TaxID=1088818 RepID=A0A2I0A6V9_9ASPA|nr:5'-nucleotidase [Apostasia shenzhenica]
MSSKIWRINEGSKDFAPSNHVKSPTPEVEFAGRRIKEEIFEEGPKILKDTPEQTVHFLVSWSNVIYKKLWRAAGGIHEIQKKVDSLSKFLHKRYDSEGFKVTRQSQQRPVLSWQAVSANRHPHAGQYMSMHQSLGVQLAQLSRDASAAGAARRATAQRKTVEVESIAAAGKPEQREAVKKYFRMEVLEKEHDDLDEDLDFRAVENGFIAVTPVHVNPPTVLEILTSTSDWLATVLTGDGEVPST